MNVNAIQNSTSQGQPPGAAVRRVQADIRTVPTAAPQPRALEEASPQRALSQAFFQTVEQLELASPTAASPQADLPNNQSQTQIRGLLHAVYQALQSQGQASADSAPVDLKSALDGLATQAAQGAAPSPLQQAFDKLSSDLQAQADVDAIVVPGPSLEQFLRAMQAKLTGTEVSYEPKGTMLTEKA